MPDAVKKSWLHKILPALTLMVMAPLIAEVLPGATRVSALLGFPAIFIMEVLIWGTGAVLARYCVRRFRLGWFNLVLLALALAVAEECLIQQTSFASLVVQVKGVEYGRAFGFNYVYFTWALLYEAIFVVCVPVALCELLYPTRKDGPWLNIWGIIPLVILFVPAAFAAWYGWNIIARANTFHLPPYYLPQNLAIISVVVLLVLIGLAIGPFRRRLAAPAKPANPPHPLVLAGLGLLVAGGIFAIEVLAFGAAPQVPTVVPVLAGVVLALLMMGFVPGWMASPQWTTGHMIAMTFAIVWGNFGCLFIGFGSGIDLYGKIVLDVSGVLLMIWLAVHALRKKV
ncbi:MAG: hypothetical protein QM647_00340 [Asticcacaulis sp.]|uniref:hypothetical protein n=1 Tax=Asticcacaulis sp. TaxID=1872648 RepID=UPI0039E22057